MQWRAEPWWRAGRAGGERQPRGVGRSLGGGAVGDPLRGAREIEQPHLVLVRHRHHQRVAERVGVGQPAEAILAALILDPSTIATLLPPPRRRVGRRARKLTTVSSRRLEVGMREAAALARLAAAAAAADGGDGDHRAPDGCGGGDRGGGERGGGGGERRGADGDRGAVGAEARARERRGVGARRAPHALFEAVVPDALHDVQLAARLVGRDGRPPKGMATLAAHVRAAEILLDHLTAARAPLRVLRRAPPLEPPLGPLRRLLRFALVLDVVRARPPGVLEVVNEAEGGGA